MSFCWWMWPHDRGSGPQYAFDVNWGQPKWHLASSVKSVVKNRVGLGVSAPKWHCWIAKVVAFVCTKRSRISGHCQIEAGCSECTSPKSSGCSQKYLPPDWWQIKHAAIHRKINEFASSTTALFLEESQGEPFGQLTFRNGRGPGWRSHWNLAREKVLHGGETIRIYPSLRRPLILSHNWSLVRSCSGDLSISNSKGWVWYSQIQPPVAKWTPRQSASSCQQRDKPLSRGEDYQLLVYWPHQLVFPVKNLSQHLCDQWPCGCHSNLSLCIGAHDCIDHRTCCQRSMQNTVRGAPHQL